MLRVSSVCLIMRSSCVTSVISLSDNKEFMCYECHVASVCLIIRSSCVGVSHMWHQSV